MSSVAAELAVVDRWLSPAGRQIARAGIIRAMDPTRLDASSNETAIRLAGIVASAMDAIITVDESQRIVLFNAAAEKTFGTQAADAIGQSLDRFIPERFRHAHREHVRSFGATNVTKRSMGHLNPLFGLRASGEEFPIEASISQVEVGGKKLFTVILRDITEKRHAEAQLLRAQRLESVGTLAGGLAHDLNNILAPIMVSVRFLQRRLANDPEGLECVAMLEQLADRGANIVRQVLSFARGIEGERVPIEVRHVVREVAEILRETVPRSIALRREIPDDLWTILADSTQLHQVLMNLSVNARDAMPDGGTLTFVAQNVVLDEHFAQMHPEARVGPYVSLSVRDTGVGIAPDLLDRIFDPFFTTKPQGQGTGLGLSTTRGIVRAHGGFVSVYSEPRQGTQFTLYFPALDGAPRAGAQDESSPVPEGQGELILVVDDEKQLREMTGRTLQAFGYKVLLAEDGPEALARFAEHPRAISVVILDMMMPLLDGIATAKALKRLNPNVRIIGSSGLPEQRKLGESEFLGFLPKPYTADQLLQLLAKVLGDPGSA